MRAFSPLHLALGVILSSPNLVSGLQVGDADVVFDAFNKVFLTRNDSSAAYQSSITNKKPDPSWSGSFDIFVAQDVYERTGNASHKTLVNDLCNTWLQHNPPPWHWDGWNDDLGWHTLALIRGYQITGTENFLKQAKEGFDYAFGRGWNTTYNDGGIWEENPEYLKNGKEPAKEALSTDSLGKVSCLIYQSTHDEKYLDRCKQIYGWVRTHLFNSTTGQINNRVLMNGTLNRSKEAYNQGTFLDYVNLLWKITGDKSYYRDAKLAMDFGKNNITVNGIFSNDAAYLNGWADEFSRGGGNFVKDNQLWSTYHSFFVANADAILQNRRPDLGITWNAWNKPTPKNDTYIANKFIGGVSWLQYTPVTLPKGNIGGLRVIGNKQTGLAVDSAGAWGNGKSVVQVAKADDCQKQRWLLTENSDDRTWNIINLDTWQALAAGNSSDSTVQWQPNRGSSQRWNIEQQSDGSFKISNEKTGLALDGAGHTGKDAPLVQTKWTGAAQQRWTLDLVSGEAK